MDGFFVGMHSLLIYMYCCSFYSVKVVASVYDRCQGFSASLVMSVKLERFVSVHWEGQMFQTWML